MPIVLRIILRKNFQIGLHGGLWYAKYDSSGTGARDSVEITDGPEVTTNWTHVAATYDGTHLLPEGHAQLAEGIATFLEKTWQ